MKKANKKGFTLIELLAVIIILGVIMLIAIPSVTQQITNSRKNSYIDTASSYISAVVVKVNEGQLPMFDTHRAYLIPVGNDDKVSCVSLESGGASPFNKFYNYAYVLVQYTGDSYNYWFLAEDGSLQGFEATETKKLEKATKDLVKSGMKSIDTLKGKYGSHSNSGYTVSNTTNDNLIACGGESCSSAEVTAWNNLMVNVESGAPTALKDAITSMGSGANAINSIIVFGAQKCRTAFE